jgi:hypothetical protein
VSIWLKIATLAPALFVPWLWYGQSEAGHIVFQAAVLCCAVTLTGKRTDCGSVDRVRVPAAPTMLIAAWVFFIVLSTALSDSVLETVFSSHQRGEGALQHLAYVVFFVALLAADRLDLRWLVWMCLGCVAWTAVYPALGWHDGTGVLGVPQLRGNLGNPLYLAMLLPLGVWASLKLRWWHAAIILAAAAAATQSKGMYVGLVVAGTWWLWESRRYVWGTLATAVLGTAAWLVPIPTTFLVRAAAWEAAIKGIIERPLGWGAENFPLVWDRFFIPVVQQVEFADGHVAQIPHFWHDRAHNVFLDRGVEWGVLGLAVWVGILLVAYRRGGMLERFMLVWYAVAGVFMFDMLPGMVGLLMLVAWSWRRTCDE